MKKYIVNVDRGIPSLAVPDEHLPCFAQIVADENDERVKRYLDLGYLLEGKSEEAAPETATQKFFTKGRR